MILKKCNGCGSILQDTEPDKPGFIPKLTTTSEYCQRCFRMKHYNELPKIVASNSDYEKVIDDVMDKNGLVIFIVDLFSFKSTFNKKMIEKLRKKDVILVANKYDLLPKSTNPASVVDWLSKECEKFSFKVIAIHLISAKKGYFIDDLIMNIENFRRGRDVYFVGCANVGKSSLINALLKRFTTRTDDLISTSNIPGTTLDLINIPFFSDNKGFVDTPGLINEGNILNKLMPTSYKNIIPNEEINPITYQIQEGNCVFIGGLFVVDILKADNLSITCYFSRRLNVHRTKSKRIPLFMEKHIGEMLTPPSADELANIEYVSKEYDISAKKNELYVSGLGFVGFNKPCKVRVTYIKGVDVESRNGIIGRKI